LKVWMLAQCCNLTSCSYLSLKYIAYAWVWQCLFHESVSRLPLLCFEFTPESVRQCEYECIRQYADECLNISSIQWSSSSLSSKHENYCHRSNQKLFVHRQIFLRSKFRFKLWVLVWPPVNLNDFTLLNSLGTSTWSQWASRREIPSKLRQ